MKEQNINDGAPDSALIGFARRFYEVEALEYWRQRYEAYLNEDEFLVNPWKGFEVKRSEQAGYPETVKAAVAFYLEHIEQNDLGAVKLYAIPFDEENLADLPAYDQLNLLVVQTTTDGDDGWLELYDEQGHPLGYARNYIELVGWGSRDFIRGLVHSNDFPPSLDDRNERTLWGK